MLELRNSYLAFSGAAKLWTDRVFDMTTIFLLQTVLVAETSRFDIDNEGLLETAVSVPVAATHQCG